MPFTTMMAVDGLADLCQTVFVDDQFSTVLWRFDPDIPDDYVLIAEARTRCGFKTLGRPPQIDEVTEIDCVLSCWSGDFTPDEQAHRAEEGLGKIRAAITTQMDPGSDTTALSIPALYTPRALITEVDIVAGDNEHGGTAAMANFTVTVWTLTR